MPVSASRNRSSASKGAFHPLRTATKPAIEQGCKKGQRGTMMTGVMQSRWRVHSLLIAVLLLTATTLTLVHWHSDGVGRGCELCHVRQLPSLYTPSESPVVALAFPEQASVVSEIVFETRECVAVHPGRAPPRSFSSIFV